MHLNRRMTPTRAIFLVSCFLSLGFAQDNPRPGQAAPPSIGLAVGQNAPAFSARDQFGQVQSNESLKGANGTVLLLFRSADW